MMEIHDHWEDLNEDNQYEFELIEHNLIIEYVQYLIHYHHDFLKEYRFEDLHLFT